MISTVSIPLTVLMTYTRKYTRLEAVQMLLHTVLRARSVLYLHAIDCFALAGFLAVAAVHNSMVPT